MSGSEIVERLKAGAVALNSDRPYASVAMSEAASHIEAQDKLLSDMEEVLTMLTSAAVLIPEMNGKECSVPRLHIEWAEKVLSEALSKKDTQ